MLSKLSEKLAGKMLRNGSISEDEQELYVYGLFMLLSSLMYLILACFLGAVLGCFFESLVFFVVFQFLRRYAGGYHAATEARCEILSALSIFACLIGIRLSKAYDFQTVLLFLSLASAVFICIFCPLDTPEKPLSKKERCYFRKITWLISALHVAVALAAFFLSWSFLFAPCCFSLILEGILLLAGKSKNFSAHEKSNLLKRKEQRTLRSLFFF